MDLLHCRASAWFALVLGAAALGAPCRAADSPFVDQLGTLELHQELDARGRLGGITVDRLGFLYVANFRDAVWRIDPEGEMVVLTRSLYGSSGNAVDSRGDLYQANFNGNTISKIARTGEVSRFADEGLAGPVGIAIDSDDALYVCNCRGNAISKVSPDGRVVPFAESDIFACPNGITFDDQGKLYVTNFNNHEILRVSEDGEVSRFVTVAGGAGNAHIAFSKGVFYVTKVIGNQLYKISADGTITHLAGTGQPGHTDGPALEATLNRPNGIAVSPGGDRLYVNTVIGDYQKPGPSRVGIRTVELMTLTRALEAALDRGGLEDLTTTYHRYKADPVRGSENTMGEMVTYGYTFLTSRRVPEASTIFRLNAESYREHPTAQYQLGELYRYIGQTEAAVSQYEMVLKLDGEHSLAGSRLQQLRSSG